MNSGKIEKLADKGFGFIRPEGGNRDIFFHATGMAEPGTFDSLHVGDIVTFDIDNSQDRPRAVNVAVRHS